MDSYTPLQGADRAAALGPFEKRLKDAKSKVERAHAQSDLDAFTMVFQLANASDWRCRTVRSIRRSCR